jgi:hypothetical protein
MVRIVASDRLRLALAAASVMLLAAGPAAAQEEELDRLPDEGWWVVVRALPDTPSAFDDTTAFAERVRRCGVEAFGDFSSKFSGFRPGYVVTVHVAPFHTEEEANALLKQARRCVPGAYLRYGRYAGE